MLAAERERYKGIHVHIVCVSSDQPPLPPARCESEAPSIQTTARPGGVPLQDATDLLSNLLCSHAVQGVSTHHHISVELTWTP